VESAREVSSANGHSRRYYPPGSYDSELPVGDVVGIAVPTFSINEWLCAVLQRRHSNLMGSNIVGLQHRRNRRVPVALD
jgi:hypothetical protein